MHVCRYDAVRLLLELPHDTFMSTLKSSSSEQKPLSEEATFFVVEKLDTIARFRGDNLAGAESAEVDSGSPLSETSQALLVRDESDTAVDGNHGAGTSCL